MTKADIRTWARANGFTVGDRGRFSKVVIDAYEAANKGKKYEVAAKAPGARPVRTAAERLNDYASHAEQRRFSEKYKGEDTPIRMVKDCCQQCLFSIGWCTCSTPMALNSKGILVPIYAF